jgi:hypothetical protein
MNDNNDAACGEQCGVCGARIGQGEGYEIADEGEPIAYVHVNCA